MHVACKQTMSNSIKLFWMTCVINLAELQILFYSGKTTLWTVYKCTPLPVIAWLNTVIQCSTCFLSAVRERLEFVTFFCVPNYSVFSSGFSVWMLERLCFAESAWLLKDVNQSQENNIVPACHRLTNLMLFPSSHLSSFMKVSLIFHSFTSLVELH